MKTLSVQQPWASLLAEGIKTIELRGWSTSYRGTLLVRASKNALPWCDDNDKLMKLPVGCLLFVGELVSVKPMQPEDRIGAMSVFWNQDYSWLIRFCYYVTPTLSAGKLKLYETPDSQIQRLPDAEIRKYHPELKLRTRHPFTASVISGELVVMDSRTGQMPNCTLHNSQDPPLAWVLVPMFAYVGGIRGGDTPITLQEIAASINQGMAYQRVEDLPARQVKTQQKEAKS